MARSRPEGSDCWRRLRGTSLARRPGMRRTPGLIALTLFTACHDPMTPGGPADDDPRPDAPPADLEPFTIHIAVDTEPGLIALKEGVTGAWRAMTMTTPHLYEAVVHGPYVATVVCEDELARTTLQVARTPGD